MLIDSHAHLDDERFNSDRDEVIKSLESNGISKVINIGADLPSSIKSVKLAQKYDNIYAAVGVHPHSASEMDEGTIEVLRAFGKRDKVVAIGEIGLDYYYDNSPRDVQRIWFKRQIQLAKELKLPIVVHSREANQETFDIIEAESDGNLTGVIHCYSGSVELMKEYIKLGYYISLGGSVTFKNAKTPKEVAKVVPIDRLLVETDSPYLTPEPHRGKRNEPLYVRHVAAMIAELKGMDIEDLAKATRENTIRLFNLR